MTELGSRVQAVVERTAKVKNHPKVVFLEWIDPPFSAGHWTPELIEFAGGIDCLGNAGPPSRTLQWSEIVAAQPDVLIVACCGFDADRTAQDADILARQAGWNELPCVQAGRVVYLDGNAYFNRPGPRLVDSLELLAHHLHPDIHRFPVTGSGPR